MSKYLKVDLSGDSNAEKYPVTKSNTIPDRTNGIWCTRELWLCRIDTDSFVMENESTRLSPFYMGIIKVTQAQFKLIMGSYTSASKDDNNKLEPVDNIQYETIRCAKWDNNGAVDCDEGCCCFMGILQKKTGMRFDLPTEAQWEYACLNARDKCKDMLNNPQEWCLDWWSPKYPDVSQTDPKGPTSGSGRVLRGENCPNVEPCLSGCRQSYPPNLVVFDNIGFRVCVSASQIRPTE